MEVQATPTEAAPKDGTNEALPDFDEDDAASGPTAQPEPTNDEQAAVKARAAEIERAAKAAAAENLVSARAKTNACDILHSLRVLRKRGGRGPVAKENPHRRASTVQVALQ